MRSSCSSQDKNCLDEDNYTLLLPPRFEQEKIQFHPRQNSQLEGQTSAGIIPVHSRLIDRCSEFRSESKSVRVDNISVSMRPMIDEGDRKTCRNKSNRTVQQHSNIQLDNQTDKVELNKLKCMLSNQLKHNNQNGRKIILKKYQQNGSEYEIDLKEKVEKMYFSEDMQDDEEQQQLHSKDNYNINQTKQSKHIYQEDKIIVQEILSKPLNKFRNFSFETEVIENSQDEFKSNIVTKTIKKRHMFRPIFNSILSNKGTSKYPSIHSLVTQDEEKQSKSCKIDNDQLFDIKNTLFMQQRSLFTNEILVQKHKDLIAQQPPTNSNKKHGHRLVSQSKTRRPFSSLIDKQLSQDRSSHSLQPRIHATQKNHSTIIQHQHSQDIYYQKQKSLSQNKEYENHEFTSPSKLLPYIANGIQIQQDQFQVIKGFQTNSCPNTGGIIKSRAKIGNHTNNTNPTAEPAKNKSSSSLQTEEILTLRPKSLERDNNIQDIQVKHIQKTPKMEIIKKNLQILGKLSMNDISLSPKKLISISKTEIDNEMKDNKQDKSRNCSRSILFDQINNSTRQNSLHLELLHNTFSSTKEDNLQKQTIIQSILPAQPKNNQKISHLLSLLQQTDTLNSPQQRKGISLTPLSDLPVFINKFVFSEEKAQTLDGIEHQLHYKPCSFSTLSNLSVC